MEKELLIHKLILIKIIPNNRVFFLLKREKKCYYFKKIWVRLLFF